MWRTAVTATVALLAVACSAAPDAGTAAPSSASTTTTTTTTTPPPERLVLIGDSIMGEVAAAVDAATDADVHYVLTIGTSTVPDDWWDVWPRVVREHRPDAVAVFVGPWDIDRAEIGTEAWHAWYGARLDRWADQLTAGGADLYWVRPLPARDPEGDRRLAELDVAFRRLAGRRDDVTLVDTWRTYRERTPDGERIHRIDGLHLCPEGAERVATKLLKVIGVVTVTGWENGDWRRREPADSVTECPRDHDEMTRAGHGRELPAT